MEKSSEEDEVITPKPSRTRGRRDRPVEQPPILPDSKSAKKPKLEPN